MASDYQFGSGGIPLRSDTSAVTLKKMLMALGAGAGVVSSGSGSPSATPATDVAFYVDTATGTLYLWYSGAWH